MPKEKDYPRETGMGLECICQYMLCFQSLSPLIYLYLNVHVSSSGLTGGLVAGIVVGHYRTRVVDYRAVTMFMPLELLELLLELSLHILTMQSFGKQLVYILGVQL